MKNIIIAAIALTIRLFFAVMPGKQVGSVSLGGAFTLTYQSSKTITEKDLLGKYTLVFFGFTNNTAHLAMLPLTKCSIKRSWLRQLNRLLRIPYF